MKFSKYIDSKEIPWWYEPFKFTLSDGSGYTPDFVVGNTIYEIKGGYWSGPEKFNKAKEEIKMFNFVLLTKKELKELGLKDL